MDAIHELMGGTGSVGGNEARQHVNKVFETMDLNQDGTISVDEFMTYCTSHQDVTQSLTVIAVWRVCTLLRIHINFFHYHLVLFFAFANCILIFYFSDT